MCNKSHLHKLHMVRLDKGFKFGSFLDSVNNGSVNDLSLMAKMPLAISHTKHVK